MVLIAIYLAVAAVVAAGAFVAAEWFREPGIPASDCPGCVAVLTGVLWPLLIVGLAQCGLVAVLRPDRHSEPDAAAVC